MSPTPTIESVLDDAERYLSLRASRWCPQKPTPRQREWLSLNPTDGLYGGAAGGGKSSCVLMGALMGVDVPTYAALIVRRTYADLSKPGAIMDRAGEWLRPTAARWHAQTRTWTFPSGARLHFGHMETEQDKHEYQSAEFQFFGGDEAGQMTPTQLQFMHSRLRAPRGFPFPTRYWLATNPGGPSHDYLLRRYVNPATRDREVTFMPARLADNPHLDAIEYRRSLRKLDETTRAQLEDGLWVRDSGGLVYQFSRERNVIAKMPDGGIWHFIVALDLGGSQIKPTTAVLVCAWREGDVYVYIRESHLLVAKDVTDTANAVRALAVDYDALVIDAGGLGGQFVREFSNRHDLPCEEARKADKLGFRKLLNGALGRGEVKLVESENQKLIGELESLEWDDSGLDARPGQPDHLTDSLLYGWRRAYAHAEVQGGEPEPTKDAEEEMLAQDDERIEREERMDPWERP